MTRNKNKYLSYAEAWRRINAAMEKGFYFEVVTLCESIISDRLLSYIRGVNKQSTVGIKTSFATLIKDWKSLAAGMLPKHGSSELGDAVDAWREERNTIIHGLTKSMPGTETDAVEPFIERAKTAACRGVLLARAVSKWHRCQLAAHQNAGRSTPGR
jgi:hypothetical protein